MEQLAPIIYYYERIVYPIRYLLSSYAMYKNNSSYFEWDIVMEAVIRKNRLDHIVFIFISIMFPYNGAVYYIRYYRTDYLILDTQYQIVMGNFYKFVQYFPEYKIDFKNKNIFVIASKMLYNIARIKRNMKYYKNVDNKSNSDNTEKLNPMAQLVIFMMKNELLNLFFYVIFRFIIIIDCVSYIKFSLKTKPNYNILQHFFIGLDRFVVSSMTVKCYYNVSAGLYSTNCFAMVYGNRFKKLCQQLKMVSKSLYCIKAHPDKIHKKKRTFLSIIDRSQVKSIIGMHTTNLKFIIHLDKRVFSVDIMAMLVFNLPFNIYLMTNIMSGKVPHSLPISIALVQLMVCIAMAYLSINLNRRIHQQGKYWPAIQFNMENVSLNLKTKIQIMNEEFNSQFNESRLGLTNGLSVVMNSHTTLKFIIFYFIYAIFSYSIILKKISD
ncbi:hypothetical protein BLOT_009003 [Blomia tropicalis]|nr:hypothetical protein BLOT_009003 [Blomia tropicalis]